jgi:uncharacterized repeat protein (TIGR01451 family)
MKKKLILLASLLGLGLMLGQPNVSTDGGLFIPAQPLALASGPVAQQGTIVLKQDGSDDFCLVIDRDRKTFCYKSPGGTIQNKIEIERIGDDLIFKGVDFIAIRGVVRLDTRMARAEIAGDIIKDSNIDDSKCDCEKRIDYSVNSMGGEPDANPADNACLTASGNCTLPAAITQANVTGGTIDFSGLPPNNNRIVLTSPLPPITGNGVSITGATHPMGFVVIDGSNVRDSNANGLTTSGTGGVFEWLEIRNFPANGILRQIGGGSTYQWLNVHSNGGHGIAVMDSPNNCFSYCNSWGNGGHGIGLIGALTTGNKLTECNIGTNTAGNSCQDSDGTFTGNGGEGVRIENASGNTIEDNVIGCGRDAASAIGSSCRNNEICRNFFGTDRACLKDLGNWPRSTQSSQSLADAQQDIGNQGAGQGFAAGASNNLVRGNVFANNRYGVIALPGSRNLISENVIFSNEVLGIDLNFPGGVTRNDSGDRDGVQNFPNLTAATQGASTIIRGQFNSRPNTTFRLEFFSNTMCHRAGNGEGQFLLGSTMVTTNNLGNATLNISLPVTVPGGQFITATATDPTGNTSEFSPCARVGGSAQPDVELTMSGPASLRCGVEFFTYSITVRNRGAASAVGVTVRDILPDCLIGSQITTSQGRFTLGGQMLTAELGTLDPGASATIMIETSGVPDCAPSFRNTASVSAPNDTNMANNTATVNTSINCGSQ